MENSSTGSPVRRARRLSSRRPGSPSSPPRSPPSHRWGAAPAGDISIPGTPAQVTDRLADQRPTPRAPPAPWSSPPPTAGRSPTPRSRPSQASSRMRGRSTGHQRHRPVRHAARARQQGQGDCGRARPRRRRGRTSSRATPARRGPDGARGWAAPARRGSGELARRGAADAGRARSQESVKIDAGIVKITAGQASLDDGRRSSTWAAQAHRGQGRDCDARHRASPGWSQSRPWPR